MVITSLVGTKKLEHEILRGLQTLNIKHALNTNINIILLTIALDRTTDSTEEQTRPSRIIRRRILVVTTAAVTITGLIVTSAGTSLNAFPDASTLSLTNATSTAVAWSRTNLVNTTTAIANILILSMLNPLRILLTKVPWWLLVTAVLRLG